MSIHVHSWNGAKPGSVSHKHHFRTWSKMSLISSEHPPLDEIIPTNANEVKSDAEGFSDLMSLQVRNRQALLPLMMAEVYLLIVPSRSSCYFRENMCGRSPMMERHHQGLF